MAKARKTRRAKRRRSAPTRQGRPVGIARESTIPTPRSESLNLAEEYQYVVADLKRIFILAAGMLALLLVLALTLR